VLGGLGSTYGAVTGAALVTALPQAFATVAEYKNIAIGLVLILTMVFMPRGIVPSLASVMTRGRKRR
jgi:branched-chain amino acid transport system permease protein